MRYQTSHEELHLVRPKVGQRREFLALAAAPTFALMALLAGIQEGGMPGMLCSAAHASPLTGMVPMYLLMSAFHSAPWLRLITVATRSARPEMSRRLFGITPDQAAKG
jgi:hypothetical protein